MSQLVAVLVVLSAAAVGGWVFWTEQAPRPTALPISRSEFIDAFKAAQPNIIVEVNPGLTVTSPDAGGITNLLDQEHHLRVTITSARNTIEEATIAIQMDDDRIDRDQASLLDLFLKLTVPDREKARSWIQAHLPEARDTTPRTILGDRNIWLFTFDTSEPGAADRQTAVSISVRRNLPR